MKRSILILSALYLSIQVYGQGYIAFNNYNVNGSPYAPVYGPETNNPQQQNWGNAADAYPAGSQTYSGTPLAGTGYSVEGWYSLAPVSNIYALNVSALPLAGSQTTFFLGGGYFLGGFPFVPNSVYDNGTYGVYLQVRVWDNVGGQYSSWPDAWSAAMEGSGNAVGWSTVFWQPVPMGLPSPDGLYNFASFNIFIVPEPSTFALLGLGGLSLWLFQRRK